MRNWKELGLLAGVGYTPHDGSAETLALRFMELRPDLREENLWEQLLTTGGAGPREPRTLFYLPAGLRGDPDKVVSQMLLARRNLSTQDVGSDQGLAPLTWYATRIYQAGAALFHLRGPSRVRSVVHNARASLLAGMAHGLQLPTLLLADETFEPPLDYQDLMLQYSTTRQLRLDLERWLDALPTTTRARSVGRTHLTSELAALRFGEYVAENEQDELPEYFVETGQYLAVLESRTSVFVGRKGTGKTANMLQAAQQLEADKRNLVVVIKPTGYELESLLEVLARLPRRDVADYLLDGLWRYLLLTEIAIAAVREAEGRAAGIASGSPMDSLRAYLESHEVSPSADFAVRLEQVVDELLTDLEAIPTGVGDAQSWLNQRLHATMLNDLRRVMGLALKGRDRVAVLIDNLDKAWERGADREQQSRVILGLLGAVGKVERDFRKEDAWRERVQLTLGIFLRADIFDVVRQHAREPDKIMTLQVQWDDPELLARIIEDRYVAQRKGESDPTELWSNFFCPDVNGRNTRGYLLWRSLPRPRDLVYLCNACVLTASNRRHSTIDADDVLAAEQEYSRFALDALLVEGSTSEELDDVLMEFAGTPHVMPLSDAKSLIDGVTEHTNADDVLSRLLRANFLGLEVADGVYDYPADDQAEQRAFVLARKLTRTLQREPNITVHPAFRPYLGIADS